MFWRGWFRPPLRKSVNVVPFWMCKSNGERKSGGKKKPSGSEGSWLDSQRFQSCDIPFGLSCHTLIYLHRISSSSLHPHSSFFLRFHGVSLHILVGWYLFPPFDLYVLHFFYPFSISLFLFRLFYSIFCPADLFLVSPRDISFLMATPWQLPPPLHMEKANIFDSMAGYKRSVHNHVNVFHNRGQGSCQRVYILRLVLQIVV